MNKIPPNSNRKQSLFQLKNNLSLGQYFVKKQIKIHQSGINRNSSMSYDPLSSQRLTKKHSYESKITTNQLRQWEGSCKKISKQKTVPKSHSTHAIPSTQNLIPQAKRTTLRTSKCKVESEIKTYEWRMSTHFPVIKVGFVGPKENLPQNLTKLDDYQDIILEIKWTQDIKYYLSDIEHFNLLNSLYILEESLVSFERLYNKFGYFQPSLKMIFITNSLRCRIWANQNIWQNQPAPPKFISKQHQKVEYFYKKVIKMFQAYFSTKIQQVAQQQTTVKRSVNLIEKLIFQLQRKQDFVQGMKFINEFLYAYSLKINNRFIDQIQFNETCSRIFTKMENLNQSILKIRTQSSIPAKILEESKEQKNIKTLKNSTTNKYAEVTQSNCKTINIKSQVGRERQTNTFKRQSQVSICSKQTIVEKKSRFSLHQDNLSHQQKFAHLKGILPNFTNQDFIQGQEEVASSEHLEQEQLDQYRSIVNAKKKAANDEEEYEDLVRQEIEKNVRERNGWLLNPKLLFETDDCAKSFQDSQPSIKAKIRDRNLTKLNRIKGSIANSIVE